MNKILFVVVVFITACLTKSFAQPVQNQLEDKIVIVVHMQELQPDDELSNKSTDILFQNINQVIEASNPENIIYAKTIEKILYLSLKKIYVEKLNRPLDNKLKIVNENVFIDENGDIFSSNGLKEFIKTRNTNQIVIIGTVAEGCITKSIKSGLKLGYEIFIIPDAIEGQTKESKTKALNKLRKKGAKELTLN